MLHTGLYPYDVLQWVLILPFMLVVAFAAIAVVLAASYGAYRAAKAATTRVSELHEKAL